MHRIDVASAATSLPTPAAAGTAGYFTAGSPSSGTPATIVDPDWMNDVQEELISILTAAGVTPDKTKHNQLLGALSGRLIGIQRFVTPGSSTYTPTPGTTFVIVEALGGGGAGGGAAITGASQFSIGGGGSAGSWGRKKITSGFSGVTVTVGAAGVGASGAVGGNGGSSSFGVLLSCPGGNGANALAATSTSTSAIISGGSNPSGPSGADVGNAGTTGGFGVTTNVNLIGGVGAGSRYGGGGFPTGTTGPGGAGQGYGAGGGGASAQPSQGPQIGGNGAPGLVIVWEFA